MSYENDTNPDVLVASNNHNSLLEVSAVGVNFPKYACGPPVALACSKTTLVSYKNYRTINTTGNVALVLFEIENEKDM